MSQIIEFLIPRMVGRRFDEHAILLELLPEPERESLDDSYFTETLAHVYIRQKRYEKALEIIRSLSLKYPKKNIYFADQIRFLEKLIIHSQQVGQRGGVLTARRQGGGQALAEDRVGVVGL